jgi:excisionase family DNA binding protein
VSGSHSSSPGEKRLLKVEDVATRCSTSKRTVYRWIEGDGLPVHRIPGSGKAGILRIDEDDLDTWLAQYRHDFTKEAEKHEQTIKLHGRRFIKSGKSFPAGEKRIDQKAQWRSRVPAKQKGTQ